MPSHPRSLAAVADLARRQELALAVGLAMFLDVFYTTPSAHLRQAMLAVEPVRLDHERDDAYLGAVGEHLALRWGLIPPPWTLTDDRDVREPWFVGRMGLGLAPILLVESPIAFRRRRIFTEAEPLRRARMPLTQAQSASLHHATGASLFEPPDTA